MSFLHPEFFYYLGVPTLLFFIMLFVKKELETSYFSKEVLNKLRVSSKHLSAKKRNILFMITAFLLIAALSEPVINDGVVEIKSKSSDIMIAIDISDSMLAEDVYPNRLKLAKQKAIELLKLSPKERVGVMGFAKNSYLVSPLSFDHNAVRFLLGELNTDSITQKGTNLLSMLQSVNDTIETDAVKYLLILSDG
jgi:Ca-activated chloride channel family protein